jgi:hypothetical protein
MGSFLPLIQAVIVGGFAIAGIIITQTWTTRRESAKRRLDLAEEVLALFYEVEDAIRFIRTPTGRAGEGRTRERAENESPDEADALDRAYSVVEKYNDKQQVFVSLKSKRYRFMATFRGESNKPFDAVDGVLSQILRASELLGKFYWKEFPKLGARRSNPLTGKYITDDFVKGFIDEMFAQSALIYSTDGEDSTARAVAEAVREVEAVADKAAKEYAAGFQEWWQRWNAHLDSRFEP